LRSATALSGGASEPARRARFAARNWAGEIEKFAPSLKAAIVHPSAMNPRMCTIFRRSCGNLDLVIHELRSLLRVAPLKDIAGVSSFSTRRRRSERQRQADPRRESLKARARIALTGTPVENSSGRFVVDLRFSQSGPARLSTHSSGYAKNLAEREHNPYGRCASWWRPTSCGA